MVAGFGCDARHAMQGTPEEAVAQFCDLARESASFFDSDETAAPLPLEAGLLAR